jgi:hypothetical protein
MKAAARTDPLAAALRVKDYARDLAKDVAGDLSETYRKSTRFVRMRAVVVGVWAVLALCSLWAACPGSGPSNALGSDAQLSIRGLMGPQLSVKNGSDGVWTDVTLTLDDTWRWTTPTVRARDRVVVALDRFTRDGGGAPPREYVPRSLTIRCAEGKVTSLLSSKAP